MATGSNRFIQYVKQNQPKVLPESPIFTRLRTTGGSGLLNSRTSIMSDEIRNDRQIIVARLGQNQPDAAIPFELSFDSFDELIQGSFGGEWVGGYTVAATVTSTVGGKFTLGTGEWEDYPINVGDYVIINGATENQGLVGYVGSIGEEGESPYDKDQMVIYELGTDSTPITTVVETEEVTFITGHYAEVIDSSAQNLTVVANDFSITRASGSWLTLGIEVGDNIWFKGFTEAANNGWAKVVTVSEQALVVEKATIADETKSTGDVTVMTSTGFLTVGTNLDFFALEEGFSDVASGKDIDGEDVTAGVYHNMLGTYVSSFALSVQPDSIITGEFNMQGLTYSGFKKDSVATGYAQSNINEVFDSFTGNLIIPEAPELQGVITGLDFTIDNGLIRRYPLMDKDAVSIGDGRSTVNGSLSAYFENADLSNVFENETVFSVAVRMEDLLGNSYLFGMPRVKTLSDGRDIAENDVTQSIDIMALGGLATDKKKTIYVLRQPAIVT